MTAPQVPYTGFVPPQSLNWHLFSHRQALRSPYTSKSQTFQSPGDQWKIQFGYEDLDFEDGLVLHQFVTDMIASGGFFKAFHFGKPRSHGVGSGTASGKGTRLTLTGITGLKAGDMVGVGGELKMVSEDQAGTQLRVTPPMRRPVTNAPVTIARPTTTFFCTTENPKVHFSAGNLASLSLEGIEVFQ